MTFIFNNYPKIISCKFNFRLCEVWTPVSRMGSGLVLPHCVRETRWDLSLVTLGEEKTRQCKGAGAFRDMSW